MGKKLAAQYGFHVGSVIPIMGDIFPGTWEFNVHAIYQGTKPGTSPALRDTWLITETCRCKRKRAYKGSSSVSACHTG